MKNTFKIFNIEYWIFKIMKNTLWKIILHVSFFNVASETCIITYIAHTGGSFLVDSAGLDAKENATNKQTNKQM